MGWEPDQPVWEFFMEHEVSNMKAAPKVGSPGAAMPPTFQAEATSGGMSTHADTGSGGLPAPCLAPALSQGGQG